MSTTLITLLAILGLLLAAQLVLARRLYRQAVWYCLRCQQPCADCGCEHPRRLPLPW